MQAIGIVCSIKVVLYKQPCRRYRRKYLRQRCRGNVKKMPVQGNAVFPTLQESG